MVRNCHWGGMSTDENVELEAPNSVVIPPGAEAVIPARWRAHPTWQGSCGLAELLAGQSTPGLVVGRTLVNTDGPVMLVRVINVSTEPHTIGRGTKVADCTPVVEVAEPRTITSSRTGPRGGLQSLVGIGPIPFARW